MANLANPAVFCSTALDGGGDGLGELDTIKGCRGLGNVPVAPQRKRSTQNPAFGFGCTRFATFPHHPERERAQC